MALIFRKARAGDLATIVGLLADDDLGRQREDASRDLTAYQRAFEQIEADRNQFLCVAEEDGQVVGTLQLSFIPGLSRGGAKRGMIEAVRVAGDQRSKGVGRAMFDWAIATCRAEGCTLVQLTTDKTRPDAHRFYDALGFEASHVGYKLHLVQG
ncbi:MAG: GNAT family N-acetyltransferase [Pseudotabrizicola sp.]|uniref:GNAT family N-acetyltransferase n=1 Tax=Pseudotabrizicola sp. TaxID=2939647 RepID=UPI0027186A53|nr:GNAT family N-acetyltransferase [Pseudotabrizicola sp.]MDO9637655.1 GNAT family N-acetyltransferase [Pseudotabrizicola sp.]